LENLQATKEELYQNTLVQEIMSSDTDVFANWCPNSASSPDRLQFLQEGMVLIQSNARYLVEIFDQNVPANMNGFMVTTQVTQYIDDLITWFFDHDWMFKLLLMVLNVLNFIMVLAVYLLSKNYIIHPPSRMYLSVVLLPTFTIATIILLILTASSGVATLMNADFCAGGLEPGSPQGTIEDAILSYQYGSMERQQVTGNLGLVYDSFLYYSDVRQNVHLSVFLYFRCSCLTTLDIGLLGKTSLGISGCFLNSSE
jgi:hypothetical protein